MSYFKVNRSPAAYVACAVELLCVVVAASYSWAAGAAVIVAIVAQAIWQDHLQKQTKEQKSELEKDAPKLLFALHDAWPYVHGNCTINSVRSRITTLMRKHGDFADVTSGKDRP